MLLATASTLFKEKKIPIAPHRKTNENRSNSIETQGNHCFNRQNFGNFRFFFFRKFQKFQALLTKAVASIPRYMETKLPVTR